jgi:hypothetical protein
VLPAFNFFSPEKTGLASRASPVLTSIAFSFACRTFAPQTHELLKKFRQAATHP